MILSRFFLAAMVPIGNSYANLQEEKASVEQLRGAGSALNTFLEQVAEHLPNVRSTDNTNGYFTACGRNGRCDGTNFTDAMPSDLNYVRCCSDSTKENWVKHSGQCPYAQSNIELADLSGNYNYLEGCPEQKNYDDAVEACDNVGARLCTKAEFFHDCTMLSGCGWDYEMIWTLSSAPLDLPPQSLSDVGNVNMPCCVTTTKSGECFIQDGTFDWDANMASWQNDDLRVLVWHDDSELDAEVAFPLAKNFFYACENGDEESLASYCNSQGAICQWLTQ